MASVLGMGILIMAVTTVAYIIVISLIMWWLSKLLKFKNDGFKPAITVAGIAGIISFVLALILVFVPLAALAVVLSIVFALVVIVVYLFDRLCICPAGCVSVRKVLVNAGQPGACCACAAFRAYRPVPDPATTAPRLSSAPDP